MRISDWSSDVCSSDLSSTPAGAGAEVTFIASRRSQVTTLQTNSPVRSTLARESFEPSGGPSALRPPGRSEEHTSELQSLMRISYAVFCLKKKNNITKLNTRKNNKKHATREKKKQ